MERGTSGSASGQDPGAVARGSMPMGRFATDFGSAVPAAELEWLMAEAKEARAG
jgi:hypothetical protein